MLNSIALPTSVDLSHELIRQRLEASDWVVDATAGNGHDTLFLAERVVQGRVFAFDVQAAAVEATRVRLEAAGVAERCTLFHAGHECLAEKLPPEAKGKLAVVMFNLGWLPGHDKTCTTQTGSTLAAVQLALDWLQRGGLLTVVVYPGHDSGEEEAEALAKWAVALPSNLHEVRHFRAPNRARKSPECWVVRPRP